jgi:hypothetical protein
MHVDRGDEAVAFLGWLKTSVVPKYAESVGRIRVITEYNHFLDLKNSRDVKFLKKYGLLEMVENG